MKLRKFDKTSLLEYLALFVLAVLFLMLFSFWTSPYYKNWYGCDASFFTMAGRGIVKGWVPYRDFFDLKGPYFFFIEAFGQLFFEARMGAFFLQVIALFFTYVLILKIGRLFVSTKKTGFMLLVFTVFHIATLWGGNTLEEYMLPLSLLSIYLTIRDLKESSKIHSLSAFITGVCFAVIAFSKISVAAPIVGLVLAIIIFYIKKRRFMDLLEYLLFAFFGILVGTTPVFIYFAVNHALLDMLYAVFVFAFKRSVDFGTKFNLRWELKISACYCCLLFAALNIIPFKKRTNKKYHETVEFILIAIICISIVTAFALHFGDPFIYYFTTAYPVLMLAFIAIFLIYDPFILFRTWRLDIPVIAFLITMSYFASCTASSLNTVIYDRDNTYYQTYVDNALEMASLIPAGDRNSVYSINMDMQWFEINQILPCYSYTINLQFFVSLDPRIEENIINKLNTDPPKWIVIGGDLSSYLPNLDDIVSEKYVNIYTNNEGSLYLLHQ